MSGTSAEGVQGDVEPKKPVGPFDFLWNELEKGQVIKNDFLTEEKRREEKTASKETGDPFLFGSTRNSPPGWSARERFPKVKHKPKRLGERRKQPKRAASNG